MPWTAVHQPRKRKVWAVCLITSLGATHTFGEIVECEVSLSIKKCNRLAAPFYTYFATEAKAIKFRDKLFETPEYPKLPFTDMGRHFSYFSTE